MRPLRACLALLLSWICSQPLLAAVTSPQPGEVYREFTRVMPNGSGDWRVTDPGATAPGAQSELPNPVLDLSIPAGQLVGATRAELLVDYWGGHPGTTGQQFRFNANPWRSIPPLTTTPTPAIGNNQPECYMQQWNPVVAVPLADLQEGANTLEGTSGGQVCFSFQWGQWGWYAVTLRVYYDPGLVPHPTGTLISPIAGGVIGENPRLEATASGGGGIERVEFIAYADAYDWDGDGDFVDWNQSYHRGKTEGDLTISRHAGTDTTAPYRVTYDTELIPDQVAAGMAFGARIKGSNGFWYVTPTVSSVTLQRAGSVLLMKPEDVIPRFWVRETRPSLSSSVTIPVEVDLGDVASAKLLVRTWNGIDGAGPGTHSTKVNGANVPGLYGENHHYSDDVRDVDPAVLVHGLNEITFNTTSEHHGIEILWPGPALLLRLGSGVLGECGDGTLDPGEQCDDGNAVADDGCEPGCHFPVVGNELPALYPFNGDGALVEDASANGNDGVLENGGVRTPSGRFDAGLEFDGVAGNVNLGPLNVGGEAGTWAAFLKPDDFGITDARILSKATSVFAQDHYFMISTVEQAGLRHLRFRLKTGGFTTTVIGTGGVLSPGVWTHAAATYDGAQILLYQDGVVVGSAAVSGPINGNSGVDVWIGDHVGGGKTFDGAIDEVLIEDRTYTPAEILTLTTTTVEPPPGCGNGIVEDGEECDDGNLDSGDGCQSDCSLPVCGDGFVDPSEECDDENTADGDGCQSNCLLPVCGDGILDPLEECDDANLDDGDGCRGDCTVPVCGDGILDPLEECDDGNTEAGDTCRPDCIVTFDVATLPAAFPLEGATATVVDVSGNGNDGVLTGGALRTASGRFGAGLVFDGVAGHVDLGTLSGDGFAGTWAAHFKVDAFTVMDARILTKASSVSSQDHYFMLSTIAVDGVHYLRFRLKLVGVTHTLIGSEPLSIGVWTHAAATYDGAEILLYQDGVVVASLARNGGLSGNSSVATWIGNHPGGGKPFHGTLDEILIDGRAYSEAEVIALTQGTIAFPSCGDGTLDSGEECDDGNTTSGDGCQEDCLLPVCGDGFVDPGEACDDGNLQDDDGCQSDCTTAPMCGDGELNLAGETCDPPNSNPGQPDECRDDCTYCGDAVVDDVEACDDGNNVDGDGCRANCSVEVCGDGTIDPGEDCDDGNLVDGDGCESDCTTTPFCGDDAINQPGETCDPPNSNPGQPDECRDDCTFCGDAILDEGEACDDGNNVSGDGCRADCAAEACGDGTVDPTEDCDDGNAVDGDGCESDCTLTPFCGDTEINRSGETCDPPNSNPGQPNECRDDCTFCGDAVQDASEACDDGNNVDGDGCRADCTAEICGDGVQDAGEACDDGNLVDGDGCQSFCALPECGDAITDLGEECDDGNDVEDDACGADCVANVCGDGEVNAGERCDDGNSADQDGCDANCLESVVLMAIATVSEPDEVLLQWTGLPVSFEVFRSTDPTNLYDPAHVISVSSDGSWVDTPPPGILFFYGVQSLCGNGVMDASEACDDGNTRDGDGCQADCSN